MQGCVVWYVHSCFFNYLEWTCSLLFSRKHCVCKCRRDTHLWLLMLVREGGGGEWRWGGTSYLSELSRPLVSYRETIPKSDIQLSQRHTSQIPSHTSWEKATKPQHTLQARVSVRRDHCSISFTLHFCSTRGTWHIIWYRIYTKISISF